MSGGRRRGRPAKQTKGKKEIEEAKTEGSQHQHMEELEDEEEFPDLESSNSRDSKNGKGKGKLHSLEMNLESSEGSLENNGEHTPNGSKGAETRSPKNGTQEDDEQYKWNSIRKEGAAPETTRSWAEIVEGENCSIIFTPPSEIEGKRMGELLAEEVAESKEYWQNVLICKVVGSYPPFMVMNGFLNRMWRNKGLEKVWQMDRGVFMAKFKGKDEMEAACNNGGLHIDGKPILRVPWSENINIDELTMPAIPVWIQLPKLELKYWSPRLIGKIVSSIGKPLKVDAATLNKERLQYARVMIEVNLKEELEEYAVFKNEYGQIMHQKVIYEWKPLLCKICKGFGHAAKECRKGVIKQIYKPKIDQKNVPDGEKTISTSEGDKTCTETRAIQQKGLEVDSVTQESNIGDQMPHQENESTEMPWIAQRKKANPKDSSNRCSKGEGSKGIMEREEDPPDHD